MLSTDPKHKAVRKKAADDKDDEKETLKASSGKRRDDVKAARKAPEPEFDDSYDDDDFDYDDFDEDEVEDALSAAAEAADDGE